MAMLRAEGIPTFLAILISWHPILWSFVTLIVGMLLFGPHKQYLTYGAVLLVSTLIVKLASALSLNDRIYCIPRLRYLPMLPAYELFAVPIIFGKGLFQRTIEWRGRHYRLGRHGMIQAVSEQEVVSP
jgi:hypothetical protein